MRESVTIFAKWHLRLKIYETAWYVNLFDILTTYLDISSNELELLPYNIGDLPNLKYLNISDNKFLKIPTSLYQLNRLENIEFEWLVYAPKVQEIQELHHGQSETKPKYDIKYGMHW